MKRLFMLLGFITNLFSSKAQTDIYKKFPVYKGNDLGLTYTKEQSFFRVWAPSAEIVQLRIYNKGEGGIEIKLERMVKSGDGTWIVKIAGDMKGKFYTFKVFQKGKDGQPGTWLDEVTDPYAKAVGVNGKRAMIVDLKETNPAGWENDKSPKLTNKTDAIIYELHVRDASIAENSGIVHKGKFLGLTERGTKNKEGLSTGLDHIKELGITHVHLLPSYDYNSVDESKTDEPQYNWGYDPLNYNVPEGSYATDPYDGRVRIKEFKQMVKAFHENGISVIMDVVYNHTALTEKSNFNQLVPGYYYRQDEKGKFSDATACGNETSSERPMMRKFILESVLYWVKEYHVDGFRFDLMGVHDIETMNIISKELHKIRPDILLYGEGWTAGKSPLPDSVRALKANASKLDRIAVFSDDIRDGIKGSVFEHTDKGFASGKTGMEQTIRFGVVASTKHPQVDYNKINYSKAPYAKDPFQTITYAECHDNHVLWDKLSLSAAPNAMQDANPVSMEEMQKLALSIVLTSQGISFLHAGTEFLRTKQGVENSYKSPDNINAIDWSLKTINKSHFEFIQALIKMRKEHPAFRMNTAAQISSSIKFIEDLLPGIVAYTINGSNSGDKWKNIIVAFNGTENDMQIPVQPGDYKVFIAGNRLSSTIEKMNGGWKLAPYSCSILYE
jgi:pullulanase